MTPTSMLEQVRNHTRQYESALRSAERALSDANAEELRLEHDIVEQLRQIAAVQIDHNPALSGEVQRQLGLRQQEEAFLRSQLDDIETEISGRLLARENTVEQQKNSAETIRAALLAVPSYPELAQELAVLESRQASAEVAFSEIAEECDRKIAEYDHNRFYSYLRAAQFGTGQYRARGLIRALDGWIARRCNYPNNRANELTLRAMREANEAGRRTRQARIATLRAAIDEQRQKIENSTGITALARQLEEIDAAIADGKKRANSLHDELKLYACKADARYIKARDLLTEAMRSASAEKLIDRVQQTDVRTDDAIAEKVVALRSELDRHRRQHQAVAVDRERAAEAYERAKSLERSLRDLRYSGSRFEYADSFDIAPLLLGYMAGSMSEKEVLGDVRSNRRELPVDSVYPSYVTGTSWGSGGNAAAGADDSRNAWGNSAGASDFSSSETTGGDAYGASDDF